MECNMVIEEEKDHAFPSSIARAPISWINQSTFCLLHTASISFNFGRIIGPLLCTFFFLSLSFASWISIDTQSLWDLRAYRAALRLLTIRDWSWRWLHCCCLHWLIISNSDADWSHIFSKLEQSNVTHLPAHNQRGNNCNLLCDGCIYTCTVQFHFHVML